MNGRGCDHELYALYLRIPWIHEGGNRHISSRLFGNDVVNLLPDGVIHVLCFFSEGRCTVFHFLYTIRQSGYAICVILQPVIEAAHSI